MHLQGPFELRFVDLFVAPGQAGVYILSRDEKHVDYVGRSKDDLRSDIKFLTVTGREYRYFWFKAIGNEWESYELALRIYRRYNPPDNKTGPRAPRNALYVLMKLYE